MQPYMPQSKQKLIADYETAMAKYEIIKRWLASVKSRLRLTLDLVVTENYAYICTMNYTSNYLLTYCI